MTAIVRLEWIEGTNTTIGLIVGTGQDISVTNPTVFTSNIAPSFNTLNGYARLVCTSGAAVVGVGSSVSTANGVVINASTGALLLGVLSGQTISIIEDSTYVANTSGTTSNTSTQGSSYFVESTTALNSNAQFTGNSHSTPSWAAYYNAFFFADQSGTACIQCSQDNSTWAYIANSTITASTPLVMQVPIVAPYFRVIVINGGTNESILKTYSSFTSS